jgi:glutathione S-transferase
MKRSSMQLYIGNKNYSSWSLRPWLLMTQVGIAFEEVPLRLNFEPVSPFKTALATVSPTAKVPVLVDDGFAVWDTLAIAEYLADKYPEKSLWPVDARARARARSLCAEMHGGFQGLRNSCPMNIEAELPEVGVRLLRDDPAVARDLARINAMWQQQLGVSGGPFLFGAFGIADAYFAPVVTRLRTYALPVPVEVGAYMARTFALPAMQQWVDAARAEHDFLPFDEPYRSQA